MTKRSIASLVSALICLALLNGCSSNKQKPQEITEPTEESVRFEISAFFRARGLGSCVICIQDFLPLDLPKNSLG